MNIINSLKKYIFSVITLIKLIILIFAIILTTWLCYSNSNIVTITLPFSQYDFYAPLWLFVIISYPFVIFVKALIGVFFDFNFIIPNVKKEEKKEIN